MTQNIDRIDRRTLLKVIGAAGASATVISACGIPDGNAAAGPAGVTGAEFEIRD